MSSVAYLETSAVFLFFKQTSLAVLKSPIPWAWLVCHSVPGRIKILLGPRHYLYLQSHEETSGFSPLDLRYVGLFFLHRPLPSLSFD